MPYDAGRYHRRSVRLPGFDYAGTAAYFITICTHGRALIFGEVANGQMACNDIGRIVWEEWIRSAEIRPEIELDAFVVMPNHVHGVVFFTGTLGRTPEVIARSAETHGVGAHGVGAHGRAPLRRVPRSLGSFVAGFKAVTTRRINADRDTPGEQVWQRNYYEHIIRSDEDLGRIREYILTNPLQWELDDDNPARRQADEHGETGSR